MPIKVNLDRIMLDRKMSLTELASRVDLTLANLSILKTNKARAIRFSTLEALCRALNCQPGDLLEHADDRPDDPGAAGGPRPSVTGAGPFSGTPASGP
jgi:putative transcriptional regulator